MTSRHSIVETTCILFNTCLHIKPIKNFIINQQPRPSNLLGVCDMITKSHWVIFLAVFQMV